jgi:hypothetical protein
MVLVPGNNPIDVDTRAKERTSEHERQVASGAAERKLAAEREDAGHPPPAREQVSIVGRVRRWFRRR